LDIIFEIENFHKNKFKFKNNIMQKKTHLAFGLMLASIFFYFGMPFQYTLLIGFIAFFPDIDWLVDKLWFKEDSVFKKMWFTIFKSKSIHRTFLHNIWAMIFLVILFGYFSKDILTMFGVFIGYLSHLLMDSLTVFIGYGHMG
jgi:membrane-bound metal-dependent hydrolase YbcI (DUF457 family)